MAEGLLSAEALGQVTKRFEQTMSYQQARLLEIAGRNTLELLPEHRRKSRPTHLNSIDDEIQQTDGKDQLWKSKINQQNHSNLKQIELTWQITE